MSAVCVVVTGYAVALSVLCVLVAVVWRRQRRREAALRAARREAALRMLDAARARRARR